MDWMSCKPHHRLPPQPQIAHLVTCNFSSCDMTSSCLLGQCIEQWSIQHFLDRRFLPRTMMDRRWGFRTCLLRAQIMRRDHPSHVPCGGLETISNGIFRVHISLALRYHILVCNLSVGGLYTSSWHWEAISPFLFLTVSICTLLRACQSIAQRDNNCSWCSWVVISWKSLRDGFGR